MPEPSPSQVDAMREWLCRDEPADTVRGQWNRGIAAGLADSAVVAAIEQRYRPGGVEGFLDALADDMDPQLVINAVQGLAEADRGEPISADEVFLANHKEQGDG